MEGKTVQGNPAQEIEKLSAENESLRNQCNELLKRVYSMDFTNMLRRLECLFKVIENREAFSKKFVVSCTDEVEKLMTLREEDENEESGQRS